MHQHHSKDCSHKNFSQIAIESLKNSNFKITKTRLAVIECLEKTLVPLSPKKIFESIQKDYDFKIDLVSVYRILETLTQLQLIHQVHPNQDFLPCHTQCEKKPNHVMLNCTNCLQVEEIYFDNKLLQDIFNYINTKYNFNSHNQIFQINGICSKCH